MPLDHQQVFRIVYLSSPGEVEAASDEGFSVDQDDLVMSDGMLAVDVDRDAMIRQIGGDGVFARFLAFIQDNNHFNPVMVSGGQGLAAQLQGSHHGDRAKGGMNCIRTASNGLF